MCSLLRPDMRQKKPQPSTLGVPPQDEPQSNIRDGQQSWMKDSACQGVVGSLCTALPVIPNIKRFNALSSILRRNEKVYI